MATAILAQGKSFDTRESSLKTIAHYSQKVVTCKKKNVTVPRVTIAYIDYVDTLVAFDLQGTRPNSQEEDLGSSWELPGRAERQNR